MRALPALSGRVVIAALERAGFEVARSRHRNDLPPGTLRGYCAKPTQPRPVSRSSLSSCPAVRRLSDASCAAGSLTPSQFLPHRGGGLESALPPPRWGRVGVGIMRAKSQ